MIEGTNTSSSDADVIGIKYDDEDLNDAWDEASATQISLEGNTAAIEGQGAEIGKGVLTISDAGTYVLRGDFTGSVVIAATSGDTVRLVLDGISISGAENAAIYCKQADKLIITLAGGSENSVTDAAIYTFADATAEEPDAVIFSKVDLTINGGGSLRVDAGFNNGIGTKDDLVIADGVFTIRAANDAVRGRDSVTILGGSFRLEAEGDGIQSNNDEDAAKGWVCVAGGELTISAANSAIQAETQLAVTGGELTVTASHEGLAARMITIAGGSIDITADDDGINAADSSGTAGLDCWLKITGGMIKIAAGSDAIDVNGHGEMSGGEVDLTAALLGEGETIDVDGTWAQTGGSLTETGGRSPGSGGGHSRGSN